MKQSVFLKGISLVIVIAMVILSLPYSGIAVSAEEIEGEIYLDSPVSVYDSGDDTSVLYFTPEETGIYRVAFDSDEKVYCYGHIIDENDEILLSGSDYYGCFSMLYKLIAGNTYAISSGIGEHEFGSHGSYTVTVSRSDIASVEFENTFVIENYDSYVDYAYNDTTEQYDIEWVRYGYYPNIVLTYTDGSAETFTESYYYEPADAWFYPEYRDNQYHYMPWTAGNTYTARASLFGITDTFEVEVIENPVESIDVPNVSVMEGEYNGTGGDYIDDAWVEYPYYYYDTDRYTVYFKDGTVESSEDYSGINYNGRNFGLSTWDDQDYYTRWDAGEHTAYASFMGVETTFTVDVISAPIIDLTVENISIPVGTGGDFITDWDEYGNETAWYCYSFSPSYTVTYADGSTETIEAGEPMYFNGEYYWLSVGSDQSLDNQWGIGEHTVTASLFGIEATFTVEITESPVVSLEIEDVVIVEGSSGNINYDTDENGNFRYYYYYGYYPRYTVTFDDGRTETGNLGESIIYNDEYYYVEASDGQSYETSWGVGVHTVNASFMGFETTFTVEIVESPIVGLYVDDVSLVYETGGYFTDVWDEEGNYVSRYIYSYYPNFTVVFKDGSTQTVGRSGAASFEGEYYYFYTCDAQYYGDEWGVGKNTAYAYMGGIESEFAVEITESPIVGIVYNNIELTENLDGYTDTKYNPETGEYDISYFRYIYTPSCTVLLSDGTVLYSEDGVVEYCGESYYIEVSDTQEESEWGVGTHTVTASLLGYEKTFKAEVKECPYERVEISGTTELLLTLFKKDGTKETSKVTSFDGYFWDGELDGTLRTTGGDFYVRGTYYVSEDGEEHPETGVTLSVGKYTTNTLSGNLWVKMMMLAEGYEGNINMYRWFTDDGFAGFDGAVTDDNIEHIITLAAWICGDIYNEGEMIWGDEWAYHYVSLNTIKANIEELFGITDIDFTKYELYDPNDPNNIRIHYLGGGGGGPKETTLYFEDGKWIYESLTEYNHYNELRIVMNEDAQIESIIIDSGESGMKPVSVEIASMPRKTSYMMGELIDVRGLTLKLTYSDGTSEIVTSGFRTSGFDSETAGDKLIAVNYDGLTTSFTVTVEEGIAGDINGDGMVNAVDSNLLKRVIAGTLEMENEESVNRIADINRDGTVNAVDSNLLKRVVAGTYIIP